MKIRYFDAFAGYGGFSLGIQQAYVDSTSRSKERGSQEDTERNKGQRFQSEEGEDTATQDGRDSEHDRDISDERQPHCVGFSEIDKYAVQIYSKHFPEHKPYGDITKLDPTTLPDFDLLCGGFPCQAFSIAGKRAGFEDTRGTLIYDVLRILEAKQPMFALLENVKGLVSHDGGKTLETILLGLQELGYYANIEIYNAKDFGVPQNRERIFFICRNIKLLSNIGQKTKMDSSVQIIQEWLFQILLNNLKEVQKLQELGSKDWVVGYLICQEINRNLKLSDGENIKAGIMPMEGSTFPFQEGGVWQNIDTWLSNRLEGDLNGQKLSTISTAINRIIESKTYSYSQMLMSILLATVALRESSPNLWKEVLSSLILIKNDTNYERVNDKEKEFIVTEYSNAHLTDYLQDFGKYFIIGHLGGFGGRQVFPIGDSNSKNIIQLNKPKHSNDRVYGEDGISPTLNTMQGGRRQPFVLNQQTKSADRPSLKYSSGGSGLLVKKDEAFCLPTTGGSGQYLLNAKIRRLTPTECERLMGLPDGWTEGVSDTQRYKLCGNGVVVNVVEEIVKRLLEPRKLPTKNKGTTEINRLKTLARQE